MEVYEDKTSERKQEITTLSASNEFSEFYKRLRNLKEHHKNNPNEISVPLSNEFDEFLKARESEATLVDFTDEEGYGKYLDLNETFQMYLNLKGVVRIDYLSFLHTFDRLFEIPKDKKMQADYKKYLEALLDYLAEFCSKVKPLLNISDHLEKAVAEMDEKWDSGTFVGWPKETSSALAHSGAALDLSHVNSWEELSLLGLDRLKSALMALGLKCGGTLDERAQRLWSTKGKSIVDLDPVLFAKSKPGRGASGKDWEKQKELAMLEAQVYRMSELLSDQRQATKENVQRKQARTAGEREDTDDEASESESEEEDESEVVYNPKNLPLGWDGKPIPYCLLF